VRRRQLFLGLGSLVVLGLGCLVAAVTFAGVAPDSVSPSGVAAGPSRSAGPHVVVSLTFNGGTNSQSTYARKALRAHGMHGTFYVSSHALDDRRGCCVTWDQARTLYREGDEIGGATLDHVDLTQTHNADPQADYAYKKHEVCDDRQQLADHGLDPRSFAYPGGAADYTFADGSTIRDLVKSCGYLSGRIAGGLDGSHTANSLPPADAFAVGTARPGSTEIKLADLQKAVTAAASSSPGSRAWVLLVFNEICSASDPSFASCMTSFRPVRDTVLSQFLDWLAASGHPRGAPAGTVVRTVREAMGAPAQPDLPGPPTYVSLTFDDGDRTQTLAGDLLLQHRLHATFYINSAIVDSRDGSTMTWDEIKALAAAGNDIGGHTQHHVNLTDPKTTDAQKRREVCDDRQRLLNEGLDPVSFAYPYAAFNKSAESIVKSCGYKSARTGGSVSPSGPTAESVPPRDSYATRALDNPRGPIQLKNLQDAVTRAADGGGGWLQILLHRVCIRADQRYQTCMSGESPIDAAELSAFLDWLVQKAPAGTQVRTVAEVMSLGASRKS
jgi:peptidoglycan/xylan/chitin deacetylase (PgdA/CDA1 family)